jgi:hypothetical protein
LPRNDVWNVNVVVVFDFLSVGHDDNLVSVRFRREFFDGILETENDFSASFFQLLKKDFLGKACWKIKVTIIIGVIKDNKISF